MNPAQTLASKAAAVEAALNALFCEPEPTPHVRLNESLRYSIVGGGKRLRPVLLLSFAGLGVFFSGIGFVSGLVRLAGCAALIVTLKQAYLAKRENGELRFGRRLSLAQCVLVSVALAAAIYIPLVLTVLGAAGGHA